MLDYFIIGIIILSLVISLFRGFVKEVISLASWIFAFYVASRFYQILAQYFTQIENELTRNAVSIAILFLVSLLFGSLINYILSMLVNKTGLSGTDRVLGACFGVLRGVLIVAAILFFLDSFTDFAQTSYWKESKLLVHFQFVIDWFFEQIKLNSSFLNKAVA